MNKPVITYESHESESFLIGTEEQLLKFAEKIIEATKNAKAKDFFGEKVKASNDIEGSLDSKAEICLDWLVVTKDNDQKDKLFYKIYG